MTRKEGVCGIEGRWCDVSITRCLRVFRAEFGQRGTRGTIMHLRRDCYKGKVLNGIVMFNLEYQTFAVDGNTDPLILLWRR
jgi:hypothetical protein